MHPEQREHEETEAFAEPDMPRVGGYRVAGNLVSRAAELEQELVEARDRLDQMERELWAARKIVRRRKALSAVSTGGVGATVGCLLTMLLYFLGAESGMILVGVIIASFLIGAVAGMKWEPPDDKFPTAAPPRTPPPGLY